MGDPAVEVSIRLAALEPVPVLIDRLDPMLPKDLLDLLDGRTLPRR
jgi:hypothetical protein